MQVICHGKHHGYSWCSFILSAEALQHCAFQAILKLPEESDRISTINTSIILQEVNPRLS